MLLVRDRAHCDQFILKSSSTNNTESINILKGKPQWRNYSGSGRIILKSTIERNAVKM
jgi:hypothetical protein